MTAPWRLAVAPGRLRAHLLLA